MTLSAADDPLACEVLMSLPPAVDTLTSEPASQPAAPADFCSDSADPRCRIEEDERSTTSPFPRSDRAAGVVQTRTPLPPISVPRGVYDLARPLDSGVLASLFRPPR